MTGGGGSGSDLGQSAPRGDEAGLLDVFISYRREDAAASAGRLADALVTRFGRNSVFMDVDTIEPGADYTEVIDQAVGHCDVLIALIGPHWLNAANARGRRLDDPQDLVRLEIESALARNIRVVPALVGGAEMPTAEQLPGALAALAKRNAVELTDKRYRSDLQFLLEPLDKLSQQKSGRMALAAGNALPQAEPASAKSIAPLQSTAKISMPTSPSAVGASREPGRQAQPLVVRRTRMPLVAALVAVLLLIGGTGAFVATRLNTNKLLTGSTSSAAWPGDYVGTWKGTGHQFTPSVDFAITLTFRSGKVGETVGHMVRPTVNCEADLTLDKATSQAITLSEHGGGCGQGVGGNKIVASRTGASIQWKEYQADPSTNSAIGTALLAQGTSGTIPGTSTLLAVPDGFIATWKGTGHQSIPSVDFAITLTLRGGQIGETVGHMVRPTVNCEADLILDRATSQAITMTEQGGGCGQGVGGNKIVATLNGTSLEWKEYQGDPSAGSAIGTALLAHGTSGTISGTENLIAVPDGFVATWKGTGHQSIPSVDFGITLTLRGGQIGETVGHMVRPTVNCEADLILDKATSQTITMAEEGGGCGQGVGGYKIVATLNGNSLDWKEYQGDPSGSSAIGTATLAKV